MPPQKLQECLVDMFSATGLCQGERDLLMTTYMTPGIAAKNLEKTVPNAQIMLESLTKKGLFLNDESGEESHIYPLPLVLLFEKCAEFFKSPQGMSQELLNSIDHWMQYPFPKSRDLKVKTSQDRSTVIQWLFDLHGTDWERVFCFGDYEAFVEGLGFDVENEWIKERAKKNRKASVVATQDGPWARHIKEQSKRDLRECLIDPRDYKGLFIMAFPEIDTTVMGGANGEISFVHSSAVANNYSDMVERSLPVS
ncbi:MAG: hypothetical protein Q8O95_05415 [bacterium]|nr:hypothetical protein [bacterium]